MENNKDGERGREIKIERRKGDIKTVKENVMMSEEGVNCEKYER